MSTQVLTVDGVPGQRYTLVTSGQVPLEVSTDDFTPGGDLLNLSNAFYVDGGSTTATPIGNIEAPFLDMDPGTLEPLPIGSTLKVCTNGYGALVLADGQQFTVAAFEPINSGMPHLGNVSSGPEVESVEIGDVSVLQLTGFVVDGAVAITTPIAESLAAFWPTDCVLVGDVECGAIGARGCTFLADISARQLACDNCNFGADVETISLDTSEVLQLTNCSFLGATEIVFTGDEGVVFVDQTTYWYMTQTGVVVTNGVVNLMGVQPFRPDAASQVYTGAESQQLITETFEPILADILDPAGYLFSQPRVDPYLPDAQVVHNIAIGVFNPSGNNSVLNLRVTASIDGGTTWIPVGDEWTYGGEASANSVVLLSVPTGRRALSNITGWTVGTPVMFRPEVQTDASGVVDGIAVAVGSGGDGDQQFIQTTLEYITPPP